MIVDTLKHADYLKTLGPNFKTALAFLNKPRLDELEDDRYDLHGDDVFAVVQTYMTGPIDQRKWEAHKKYIDLHILVRGREKIGYARVGDLNMSEEYSEETDCMFLKGEGQFVELGNDHFAMCWPGEAHMPGVAIDAPENVRKVVIKIFYD